jgi:hypothetical protein
MTMDRPSEVELPVRRAHPSAPDLTLAVARDLLRSSALEFRGRLFEKEQGTEGIDEFDEHAVQLVACSNGQIVAAARFVAPEQRPFELERHFDLSMHAGRHRRIGELSRYCLHEEWRGVMRGTLLHFGMLKLALEYARVHRIDSIVGSVQPQFHSLYRRVYFEPIGPTFFHPIFGHTTIMLLRLDRVWSGFTDRTHPLSKLLEDPRIPSVSL